MKAAEMRAALEWLDAEVAALRAATPAHAAVIERLATELHQARVHLLNIDNIIRIGHPALVPHAFPILHTLVLITSRVGVTYLPALQHQGPRERFVRGLVRCAARAVGLTWLTDVVVRLDGPHAAYVAYPELPILYAPPRQASSLIDLPGLYHELGHAALEFDRTTGGGGVGVLLRGTVTQHFAELARRAGPLTPERRAARESRLAEAATFWSEARLAEIFCDVLATVVCGPAHYLSFVDLAFRDGRNPFGAHASHPPLAARVRACERTLTLPHQREPVVEQLRAAWATHEREHTASHEYEVACSASLIDALVHASLEGISAALPGCQPFTQPLSHPDQIGIREASGTLEELLNRAAVLLVLVPGRYAEWERDAVARCGRIAEEALGD
jgi:hypothetical protein